LQLALESNPSAGMVSKPESFIPVPAMDQLFTMEHAQTEIESNLLDNNDTYIRPSLFYNHELSISEEPEWEESNADTLHLDNDIPAGVILGIGETYSMSGAYRLKKKC
jgi:hypothetical protein